MGKRLNEINVKKGFQNIPENSRFGSELSALEHFNHHSLSSTETAVKRHYFNKLKGYTV